MREGSRPRTGRIGDRMVALFLLGAVATGPPVLGLMGAPVRVFGIPLLFAWLFGIWAAVIGLLALAVTGRGGDGAEAPPEE